MTQRPYEWLDGAILQEHSKRKHKILREYLSEYLRIRCCRIPQQTRFRFAIIDGFSGGGAYVGGEPGSPLIFLEVLKELSQEIAIKRAAEGMAKINLECLLIFNDVDPNAIEILKKNTAPMIAGYGTDENLRINVEYLCLTFSDAYPVAKEILASKNINRNVFFNLDQCGSSHVPASTLADILQSYVSAEVLYTFAAQSMFTFLSRDHPKRLAETLAPHGISASQISELETVAGKREWKAAMEQVVFEAFKGCAPYVSPFAINNPDGWLYWLLHLANDPKARQVYNDLLHDQAGVQGHHGRSGLKMLKYDPSQEGQDYLFAKEDRERAVQELQEDIPHVVSEYGDAIGMAEFWRAISNETPAHTYDIGQAILSNPDLTIKTSNGGNRRSVRAIKGDDVLILNPQRSLFIMPPLKPK